MRNGIFTPPHNSPHKDTEHFYWLDWMKAIGIGLIVYGHFFSLYDIYCYVFNVPLFFLVSGFLTKRETDSTIFFKKITFNLAIPLLIICSANYPLDSARDFIFYSVTPENPLVFFIQMLLGFHRSLGAFWFVYTLIILKIIFQYTKKAYIHILWTMLFLAGAYIINNHEIWILGNDISSITWSVTN